jgi:arginase
VRIQVVALPYNVEGKGTEGASGPAALLEAGLPQRLREQGHEVPEPVTVALSPADEAQYGAWNRVGLAGGRLADLVSKARREGSFILGLLPDCNGVLGVLGGLQRSLPAAGCVGLVYVDAHGDYNTPETSPSGMLGGMPVAVAAGKCLHRLRKQNRLETPLRPVDIVMMGLRDLDLLERQAVLDDRLVTLTEHDLVSCSAAMRRAVESLAAREDLIYVHVDLDILDPSVAPAAGLPSPGGLTGEELGRALKTMVGHPKVAALSLVSYRADSDRDRRTLGEVMSAVMLAGSGL